MCEQYRDRVCHDTRKQLRRSFNMSNNMAYDDFIQSHPHPCENGAMLKRLIGWKAAQEAQRLCDLPRNFDVALGEKSEHARVITSLSEENHHIINRVNTAWEALCGYERGEVVGQSLRIIQGEDTDQDVVTYIAAATMNACDCSVLLLNYKKSGEPFLNRVRIVGINGKKEEVGGTGKPMGDHFLAELHATK